MAKGEIRPDALCYINQGIDCGHVVRVIKFLGTYDVYGRLWLVRSEGSGKLHARSLKHPGTIYLLNETACPQPMLTPINDPDQTIDEDTHEPVMEGWDG